MAHSVVTASNSLPDAQLVWGKFNGSTRTTRRVGVDLNDHDFLVGATIRRTFVHPELGSVALFEALAMYAWHGRHHAAHIQNGIKKSG